MDPANPSNPLFDHASDPVFQHLRLNHFPIILGMVAVIAIVIALISRRDGVWRYAMITMLIAGITAFPAYWTGERAYDKVYDWPELNPEALGDHEESAEVALWALLAAGGVAGVALVKKNTATRIAFVVTALVAVGATVYTGAQAGNIVHGEQEREHSKK